MCIDGALFQVTALVSDQRKITDNCPNYSKGYHKDGSNKTGKD